MRVVLSAASTLFRVSLANFVRHPVFADFARSRAGRRGTGSWDDSIILIMAKKEYRYSFYYTCRLGLLDAVWEI